MLFTTVNNSLLYTCTMSKIDKNRIFIHEHKWTLMSLSIKKTQLECLLVIIREYELNGQNVDNNI